MKENLNERETKPMPESEEELKARLSQEQYQILREGATEAPFTGELLNEKRDGMFKCAACGQKLFTSDKKFDSGTGWPSFDEAIPGSVLFRHDDEHGMNRTEIVCSQCGSHLGHVFDDGPTETGKRFCVNSACLGFEEEK